MPKKAYRPALCAHRARMITRRRYRGGPRLLGAFRLATFRLRSVTAVLAVALLVPAGALAQDAVLENDLDGVGQEREHVEQELEETREAESDARAQLNSTAAELDDAEAELEDLEAQLASNRQEFEAATAAAKAARERLDEVGEELEEAEAEFAVKQDQLQDRVRAAFKYGQVTHLETLVGTADVADFLNNSNYVASVLDGDRELVDEITALLHQIEAQQAEARELRGEAEREERAAETAENEIEAATSEQAGLVETVRQRRDSHESAVEELAEDRTAVEDHLAGLEAESQRIEAQLAEVARQQAEEEARQAAEAARIAAEEEAARQAAEEAARIEAEGAAADTSEDAGAEQAPEGDDAGSDQGGSAESESEQSDDSAPAPAPPPAPDEPAPDPPADGDWTRPVGGPVTSPFGPRWGRNHNGVDLGGPTGTPVSAARSGTVVHVTSSCHPTNSFGCGGGFGNYVTVSHQGGYATIYAHLSSVSVGVGDTVSNGQQVGAVGNSGSSYGAHLHFEVRVSGAPRNPCGYINC